MLDALSRSYYVVHSKLTGEYGVVINNEEVLSIVKEDYLKELLGEETFGKMMQKVKDNRSRR